MVISNMLRFAVLVLGYYSYQNSLLELCLMTGKAY